ncbi:roadblock/LC7 domain-containing protein [Polymorphospora sp. NPDC050346]|uniref:roadblock/LC7 domain-containing protein n=1 Tax=Polymorphospora sp. NPDC050346 TaxID=3155780 RepID=UPI0033CED831
MDADVAIKAEINALRRRLPDVSGTVLAGLDGMLIASDVTGIEPSSVAALSAAHLGLGQRFALTAGLGTLHETVLQGTDGYVIVYAAGSRALLTVLTTADVNLPLLHLDARQLAARLGTMIERASAAASATPVPRRGGLGNGNGSTPLAVRTPMATLPGRR